MPTTRLPSCIGSQSGQYSQFGNPFTAWKTRASVGLIAGRRASFDDAARNDEAERRHGQPPEVHAVEPPAQVVEETGPLLQRRSGGAAQRPRLQPIDGPVQRRPVDGLQRRRDGTFGADVHARRTEEFGDVVGQQQLRRRHLAEAEVDDPHRPVIAEEHVREAEVAVGDAVAAQIGDRLPDRVEHVVGDIVRIELVERPAGHRVVGQHQRLGLGDRQRPQARRPDAEVTRGEREECFVLDGPTQRRERALVAEVAALQLAVDPEHEVGAALVPSEHLHEQSITVGRHREVGGRSAGVDARRRDVVDGEPDRRQSGGDRLGAGPPRRGADDHDRGGAGEPSEEHGLHRSERHLRRQRAHQHERDDGDPSDLAPPAGQPRCSRGQRGGEHSEADRRREPFRR